jgi:LmbE family N-acetylglucosaminyl deacetylase
MKQFALPSWKNVLTIVAHPDDESFGLGAVLSTFIESGTSVSVLCFTRGEASSLHGVLGNLSTIRGEELRSAAREIGIADVHLKEFPDGGLEEIDVDKLAKEARDIAAVKKLDGILAFDSSGVTGHHDHIRATAVALWVASELQVGLLGWTVPTSVAQTLNEEFGSTFAGHTDEEIDIEITVDRSRQRRAIACHPSQALPGSLLWRRLELLSDRENLRWLHKPTLA